jgi:hypothetical protein
MSDLRNPSTPDNPEVVHEDSDVNVRAILGFGAALAAVALIAHLFLWWLQATYQARSTRSQTHVYPLAAGQQDQLPPMPRLQDNPQLDMRTLRAQQQELLNGYGWVNRDSGTARIPIEEAMRIVVQRGLPTKDGPK